MYKGLIKAYNDAEKPGISYLIAMPLKILYHFRTCENIMEKSAVYWKIIPYCMIYFEWKKFIL